VYKKLSLLGKGGFAECFLTQQKDTNRQAATKVIPKKLLDSHRTKIRVNFC
jgi:serine/threonine protein kinase